MGLYYWVCPDVHLLLGNRSLGGTLMDCGFLRRTAQGSILAVYLAAWARELLGGLFGFPPYHVTLMLTGVFLLVFGVVSLADLPMFTGALRRRNGRGKK